MRLLQRNLSQFAYALYLGKQPIADENGFETGEYEIAYSDPVTVKANISPARGEASTRQFGDSENYDKVIVTDNVALPIDINSVLWVDSLDISKPHDYIVRKVAESQNSVSYAIQKVDVS